MSEKFNSGQEALTEESLIGGLFALVPAAWVSCYLWHLGPPLIAETLNSSRVIWYAIPYYISIIVLTLFVWSAFSEWGERAVRWSYRRKS